MLLIWLMGIILMTFMRRDFAGDGLRHLEWAFLFDRPVLGMTQWLLFPGFIYFLLEPFVMAGWVTGMADAIPLVLILNVLSGIGFLFVLRIWLASEMFEERMRALALAFAASAVPLLRLSSDTLEPIFPGMIAVTALMIAAVYRHEDSLTKSIFIPTILIVLTSFLYQGVLLAMGFMPLAVGIRRFFKIRVILLIAAVSLLIPIALMISMMLRYGRDPWAAFQILSTGSLTPLINDFLKKSGLLPHAVAFVFGPPQGLYYLRNFSGLRNLASQFGDPSTTLHGVLDASLLLLGIAVMIYLVILVIKNRNWALLIGLCSILVLPVLIRHQQYGYVKYYVFLPIFLAHAARYIPSRVLIGLIAITLGINGAMMAKEIHDGRVLYHNIKPFYERLGANACWISEAWHPPMFQHWTGSDCPMLGLLGGGEGLDADASAKRQSEEMSKCLKQCFCQAGAVYTDDFSLSNRERIEERLTHFRFSDPDKLIRLLKDPEDGGPALQNSQITVYRYSDSAQAEACKLSSEMYHEIRRENQLKIFDF